MKTIQTAEMQKTKVFEQWLADRQTIITRYRAIEKGEILAEYNQLETVVNSKEFKAKKTLLTTTKYADTPEGKTMAQYKSAKLKGIVLLYNLLKKEAWKERAEVVEYLQLQEQVMTPEFQKENAFWKNEKRWLTTPEGVQEKRHMELAKHADILFFQSHTEAEIAELESYKLVWDEDFEGGKMGIDWETGFVYPKGFKPNHSHVSEQQAYTRGQNTVVENSVMTITTQKEAISAAAWHPTKGMLMHDFAYTSDVWHTKKGLNLTIGVLQAKIAVSGKAKHAVCLTAPKMKHTLPIWIETSHKKGYAIYTVVWDEKNVKLYLNNVEVATSKNTLAGEDMHILLRSYLPEKEKAGKGVMSVDWIRVYTK
jgi:hypothetical protein